MHRERVSWVLFFDGDCAFCSTSARWVSRLDRRGRIDFASLQGSMAGKLDLRRHAAASGGTMVLLREADGRLFFRSDALIELARAMGGIWNGMRLIGLVPRAWRDAVYQFVADRRHLLRGSVCSIPDDRLRQRLRD